MTTIDPADIPLGARVRVTDVIEGVVTAEYDPRSQIVEVEGLLRDAVRSGRWTRTWELLELPRPAEPTEVNAVVLARAVYWAPSVPREVFTCIRGYWRSGDGAAKVWDNLKDITVLHPGGVE